MSFVIDCENSEAEMQYKSREQRTWEPFTPLVQRISQEVPELVAGLQNLQNKMLVTDFEKYINSLINLRQGNGMLLLITGKEMYRSIIESKFLPDIKKSFGVDRVRVISQS